MAIFAHENGLKTTDSDSRLQSEVDLLEVGLNCQPQHSQPSNESMGLFSKLSFLRGNHTFPHSAVSKISFTTASLFNGDSRVTD
jgi:hypothetical protein